MKTYIVPQTEMFAMRHAGALCAGSATPNSITIGGNTSASGVTQGD